MSRQHALSGANWRKSGGPHNFFVRAFVPGYGPEKTSLILSKYLSVFVSLSAASILIDNASPICGFGFEFQLEL